MAPSTALPPDFANNGESLPSVVMNGVLTPAERSAFRNEPESGTKIDEKITSGLVDACWIFVTCEP